MNAPVAQHGSGDVVELRIPAKAEWVSIARLAISAIASRMQFSIEEIEDVKLAVAEACVHAIGRGGEYVELLSESLPDGLCIHVRNFGGPAPAETVNVETADESSLGGLGVFLIRALMDRVDYEARPQGGSDLVMFKRRST